MFYVWFVFKCPKLHSHTAACNGHETCFTPVASETEGREIFEREFGTGLYEITRIVPLTPDEIEAYERNRA